MVGYTGYEPSKEDPRDHVVDHKDVTSINKGPFPVVFNLDENNSDFATICCSSRTSTIGATSVHMCASPSPVPTRVRSKGRDEKDTILLSNHLDPSYTIWRVRYMQMRKLIR